MWLQCGYSAGPSAALEVVTTTHTPLHSLPGSTKRRLPARPAYSDSIAVRDSREEDMKVPIRSVRLALLPVYARSIVFV